jgi:hypothetical protein
MVFRSVIADVTVQEEVTVSGAIGKGHATANRQVAADKQRSDMQIACDGMKSTLCASADTVDITRLDRGLTWSAVPAQKRYTEIPFSAAGQRADVSDHAKSCATARPIPAPFDPAECDLSAPVLAVSKTSDVIQILGHETQRTHLSLTQGCKVKASTEGCQVEYILDVWLTRDEIPGLADQQSFQSGYQRKLRLVSLGALDSALLQPLLAPYIGSLQQLADSAADLKGYPLKTVLRVSSSGVQCGSGVSVPRASSAIGGGVVTGAGGVAADAAKSSTTHAAGWGTSEAVERASGNGIVGYVAGSAAGAFTQSVVGGLFAKKTKPGPAATHPADASASSTPSPVAATLVMELVVETAAINAAAIPSDRFELPSGWKMSSSRTSRGAALASCPGI